ncbi:MAG: hypothetical protein ABUS51_00670 [Acidobacteriota bacterium]
MDAGPILMKKDADYFEGGEPRLIFIAKRLKHAKRLEAILDRADIDYGVETDEYHGGVIFRSTRVGAFFYVLSDSYERAVAVMGENGFEPAPPEPETGPNRQLPPVTL